MINHKGKIKTAYKAAESLRENAYIKDRHENISVTAWAALHGVFLIGGVLEYGHKEKPPCGGRSVLR